MLYSITMKVEKHPNYLAAIDHQRNRIFVLAPPSLSAIKANNKWHSAPPLPAEEIPHYVLITDYEYAQKLIEEAKEALATGGAN